MLGLIELHVTAARERIAESEHTLSFTAYIVAAVARAAAAHPAVHAYPDWRGRLVEHRHVDVTTIVEVIITTRDGLLPLPPRLSGR